MVDAADRANKFINEEHERRRRLTEAAEAEMPTRGRRDEELTPEQQHRDYLEVKGAGGFEGILDEWTAKFGKKKAVFALADWGIEQEPNG